jgi:hypothetical protein
MLLSIGQKVAAAREMEASAVDRIDLSGQWQFQIDRGNEGVNQQWFNQNLKYPIFLPGILQAQGYGDDISVETPWVATLPRDMKWHLLSKYAAYTKPGNVKMPYLSQPLKHYLGVAWYQREIEIPAAWSEKRVQLSLERPHWETTVWIDEKRIGSCNSTVASHDYEIGRLAPGKHTLSIRIDNGMILPYRMDAHSVSDAVGASWNGIVGQISLAATSQVWIDNVQVFPNIAANNALVQVTIGNITAQPGTGTLFANDTKTGVSWGSDGGTATLTIPLGDASLLLWDEFHPRLQKLRLRLTGTLADDERTVTFGIREIRAEGKKILLNGHEVNVRGTNYAADFPLTGYPATDVLTWKKIFTTCKAYGMNHVRFHSVCPPDAAFTAADEIGIYLQVEAGMWNNFSNKGIPEMLEAETKRIIREYGNHPSFLLFSPSNEPAGRWQPVLIPWATRWHDSDPRRLYAENTGRCTPTAQGPQYVIAPFRGKDGWFGQGYERQAAVFKLPVITHEVGEWAAYPDFDVIRKFTGYLRPSNYEVFRDLAGANGLLEKNKEFSYASGKFQTACYKEEIEANLRSADISGFQLLGLTDYLGQGTSPVGVLDAFWEPKGYVSAAEFKRFCNDTVPLARLADRVYRSNDPLNVPIEIAHYGPKPIAQAKPYWLIRDNEGRIAARGEFPTLDIPIGKNIPLGRISISLASLPAPQRYKLVVGLSNTCVENDWSFWVYPDVAKSDSPGDVVITSDWEKASVALDSGGKVLFLPPADKLKRDSPPLNDVPIFWNRLLNPKDDAMLGLWCDVKHGALREFPTESFCDWQWSAMMRGTLAINIGNIPATLRPIVSAIDDWNRNYKLAVLFECTVGRGRLMVCAVDLQSRLDRHLPSRMAASQLRISILNYMVSDRFKPKVDLTIAELTTLWPGR